MQKPDSSRPAKRRAAACGPPDRHTPAPPAEATRALRFEIERLEQRLLLSSAAAPLDPTSTSTAPGVDSARRQLAGPSAAPLDLIASAATQQAAAPAAATATIMWTNPAGGDWDVASNWSAGVVPAATDDVLIDVPGNVTVTFRQGSATVKSLTSNDPFTLSGGTLTVNGNMQVNNRFTLSGGTLTAARVLPGSGGQGITGSSGTLDGVTLAANLTVSPTGNVSVTDGLTLGNATVTLSGGTASFNGAVLAFAGTQTLGGTGTVIFTGSTGNNAIYAQGGNSQATAATLTIGPGVTIHSGGSGGIIGGSYPQDSIVSQGTINADVPVHPVWAGYAGDAQHSAISPVASQPLQAIHWQTPVDLYPQYSGNDLLIHYGSPLITQANTVIVPVKTGAGDGFQLSAFDGATGAPKWTLTTDYSLPPHGWTPPFSPTLTPSQRLYYPGAGGTVYYRDGATLDTAGAAPITQVAFYGNSNYTDNPSAYNSSVYISTPITSDSSGNIYFGFQVTGATPLGLQSGIARIAPDGAGTYVSAATAAADSGISEVVQNCAPAISHDGSTVYIAVSNSGSGYLVALNSTTLAPTARVALRDPQNNSANPAWLNDSGTASPTVAPNGDVYFGVLENPFPSNRDRGWLLHYSADLSITKTPGSFGWDDTASIVPASMVHSYQGSSSYLLMTKYNDYVALGGSGVNRIAILDPSQTQTDPVTGQTVMAEVMTIAGVTPDGEYPNVPGAVREWCINTAVVDPATDSILANSEDGKLYRWSLDSNTFTEVVTLTPGVGEAYTPTIIGADGTVYAINNATLFAVGAVPAPPVAAMDRTITLGTSTPWTNTGTLKATTGTLNVTPSISLNGQGIVSEGTTATIQFHGNVLGNTTSIGLSDPQGTTVLNGSGTPASPQLFEAMSQDVGNVATGYNHNFAYGTLALGNITYVKLVDQSHNAPGNGLEAVYTQSLIVPAGCTLDLNGLHLYARAVQNSGTIVNGSVSLIPNSGPLSLSTYTPGSISVAGTFDEWTFFGRSGHTISVLVNPGPDGSPAPLSPQLQWANVQLLDANNNLLVPAVANTGPGRVVTLSNVVLPADGVYKIRINASAGHANSTGNYMVSAWDVTPNLRSLNIGSISSGTIATRFALDQWTFAATAGMQIQMHLNGVSSPGLAFTLTGPGGATVFQGINGDSALANLPSSGTYTLSAYGTNGVTGSYSFVLQQTSATDIVPGTPFNGSTVGAGQAQLFRFSLPTSKALLLSLTDLAAGHVNELYLQQGGAPTRSVYAYRSTDVGAGSQQILIPNAASGTWYALVYSEAAPSPGGFTLLAQSGDVFLTGATPAVGGTVAPTTFTLTGAGFNAQAMVQMVTAGGATFTPAQVTVDSSSQMTATFAAGSVPAGTYTIRVTSSTGATAQLSNVFTMFNGGRAILNTQVVAPSIVGYHQPATIYVKYSNTGTISMPAPLISLTAVQNNLQGAFLTLNPSVGSQSFVQDAIPTGYATAVTFTGSGATPGLLQPGESVTIPVHYAGWRASQWDASYPTIYFNVSTQTPDNPTSPGGTGSTRPVATIDPIAKIGASGYGPSHFVDDSNPLPYTIDFENDSSASAPAQAVTITDQLSSNLDWKTFALREIGFGSTFINVPANRQYYSTTVPMTYNGQTFEVQIEAGIHSDTGRIYATFQSLDPQTHLPPQGLFGFLGPEDGTGRGMGHVSYSVKPKAGLLTGTQIRNGASIIFDGQPQIATDQVSETDPSQGTDPSKAAQVTIDGVAPTSSVSALPPTENSNSFTVSWNGQDDAGASGIGSYDIYVSTDGGLFNPWLTGTAALSATYNGQAGHGYSFYSVAHDNVGNVQLTPIGGQASTTLPLPSVSGRLVFYNNTYWNSPLAGHNDDTAVDASKSALKPGQTASFINYTGALLGINGVMLDIANLAGTPIASDFTFKVGNDSTPSGWATAPAPLNVIVRPGMGTGGSDRIELIWADNVIQQEWLQVTVMADAATGLTTPDVFYFGSAIGETGNDVGDTFVDASDMVVIRDNITPFGLHELPSSRFDLNHDGFADASDMVVVRDHIIDPFNRLKLITPPAVPAPAPAYATTLTATWAASTPAPRPAAASTVPVLLGCVPQAATPEKRVASNPPRTPSMILVPKIPSRPPPAPSTTVTAVAAKCQRHVSGGNGEALKTLPLSAAKLRQPFYAPTIVPPQSWPLTFRTSFWEFGTTRSLAIADTIAVLRPRYELARSGE